MTSAMERKATTSGGVNGSPQGQDLQEAASGLMHQAARTADAQASTTMTRVGETLQKVATHIREAGNELRTDQPQVAGFIDAAAERVEGAATYLRDRDASEAIENAQSFARRQPALVIGAGLTAGLIIGRLLRGGAEAAGSHDSDPSYRDRSGGAYGSTYARRGSSYGSHGYDATDYGTSSMGAGRVAGATGGTIESAYNQDALDEDTLSDSATGEAVRDRAATARSR